MIPLYEKSNEKPADDGSWVICTPDQSVISASEDLAHIRSAAELVKPSAMPELEDLLAAAALGGEISVFLPASDGRRALVESFHLFSSNAVRITLFANEKEYLAENALSEAKLGRVFTHLMGLAASKDPDLGALAEALSLDPWDDVGLRHKAYGKSEVFHDASALFDMIKKEMSGRIPFSASFENRAEGQSAMCVADSRRMMGIVLLSAAVAARLSEVNGCDVIFDTDGASVSVTVKCQMKERQSHSYRGSGLERLYGLLSATPAELIALEYLTSDFIWETEVEISVKGEFSLNVTCPCEKDADRLKYRDGFTGVPEIMTGYRDYLCGAFSPEPEKQCKDQ